MSDEKRCPVMYASHGPVERRSQPGPQTISMSLAERAWSVYRQKYGAGQSLARMIERGGFHAGELDDFVPGWRDEEYELTRLRAEVETLRAERDAERARAELAEANYAFMVERAANEKLDGYRELGARAAAAEADRDAWKAKAEARPDITRVDAATFVWVDPRPDHDCDNEDCQHCFHVLPLVGDARARVTAALRDHARKVTG
jgi:hypothetical protein